MRSVVAALLLTVLASPAWADEVDAPELKPTDTWTYSETVEGVRGWHQTHVDITVLRTAKSYTVISFKEVGSPLAPTERMVGSDWSRMRSINGKEQVYNKRFDFPMSVGKAWNVDYTEDSPNRQVKSQHVHLEYGVTGWENVTVPAGTFKAMKIEADGQWTAEIAPAVTMAARTDAAGAAMQTNTIAPKTVTGRLYKAYWYVPAVKRYVKAVEEVYNAGGTRTRRLTEEMEKAKMAE